MVKKKTALRPILLWVGSILGVGGNLALDIGRPDGSIALVIGLAVVLIGCYLWTREKNRAWVFMLWGLLAPVGFLGIMFLKDKSIE